MRFYAGTYTRMGGPGIAVCDVTDDRLKLFYAANELKDPTYVILAKNRKRLYAVSGSQAEGSGGGSVASYDIIGDILDLRSHRSTGGDSPCHLVCSGDERFLYAANYLSGSLAVFPITAEGVGKRIQLIQHEGKGPHPTRQTGPHLHHVSFIPGTDLLCSIDLGIDAVVTYRQDRKTGLLTLADTMKCEPGLGPRHMAYNPASVRKGGIAYLAHELGSAVSVLRRSGESWITVQTLSTLPAGWTGSNNTCAAVKVSPDGSRIFASNRGHDSIAVFKTLKDGERLVREGIYKTGGKVPRDFALLPDGRLLVAHQDEGGIVLLKFTEAAAKKVNPAGTKASAISAAKAGSASAAKLNPATAVKGISSAAPAPVAAKQRMLVRCGEPLEIKGAICVCLKG